VSFAGRVENTPIAAISSKTKATSKPIVGKMPVGREKEDHVPGGSAEEVESGNPVSAHSFPPDD